MEFSCGRPPALPCVVNNVPYDISSLKYLKIAAIASSQHDSTNRFMIIYIENFLKRLLITLLNLFAFSTKVTVVLFSDPK